MTGRAVRQSIAPTYDSAVTGPRYRVTTTVAGRTVGEFRRPIPDPFACTRVRVGFRDLIRGLLRGSLEVVVQVSGADRGIEDDVLELDAQTLVPGSTRRQDFDGSVNAELRRIAQTDPN